MLYPYLWKKQQIFLKEQKKFNENENIQVEIPTNIDWKNELTLQQKITAFDIGIATLIDNEIQRSKSGIKAKQYLNNGVPVLGTNLPENDWVIKDGVNGFFCSNNQEFKQRIIEFYSMNDQLYSDFLKNTRKTICEFDNQKYYTDFTIINKTAYNISQKNIGSSSINCQFGTLNI